MRKSYLWAGIIIVGLGSWMASPYVLPHAEDAAPEGGVTEAVTGAVEAKPFQVRVKTFTATLRQSTVSARGVTEPSKAVEVRARTAGVIIEANAKQGQVVKEGDILCKLDMAGRLAQLTQAKAALASAQRDFDATARLADNDFATKSQLSTNAARLDAAKAVLETVEWDMGWTDIKATARGVLIDKPAEAGSLLDPGGLCATISQLDPLLITVQVGERYISYVNEGMKAKATLATGEQVAGTVRFIARTSNLATRTFRVEVEVANGNSGRPMRAGVTAELFVDLPPTLAHLLPGSLLGLNDQGKFGVRKLNDDNTTSFVAVDVIAQETTGVWVMGLPAAATLVITGQDYVRDGEKVEPVTETAAVLAQ